MLFLTFVLLPLALLAGVLLGVGGVVLLTSAFITRRSWAGRESGTAPKAAGISATVLGSLALVLSLIILVPSVLYALSVMPALTSDYRRMKAERAAEQRLAVVVERVQRVVEAEAAYSGQSGGAYGTLECLADPRPCLRGYAGPPFLAAGALPAGTQDGYRWSFHPGPASAPAPGLAGYVVVAVPVEARAGWRSVCGTAPRRLCTFAGPTAGSPLACPADCVDYVWSAEADAKPPFERNPS
jgi:hypothetical protein